MTQCDNHTYLRQRKLRVERLGRGLMLLDTSTHESFLKAREFVRAIDHGKGLKIACSEEIASHLGYISAEQLKEVGRALGKSAYRPYLLELADRSQV